MVATDEQSEGSSARQHEMNEKLSGDQAIGADPGTKFSNFLHP